MAAPSSTSRPSWQRNPVFRFFASLKLAVVLLAVLIIGAIAGTLYESTFDAKVARAYVYGAPWFNIWLLLLASNLIVSALSRWPWKKHHVAFLITHLGIITLLTGSLIGRTWGIEGTITLFKGEPPSNRLLVDQHQLRVRDTDGIVKGYPAEFIHRPPTPQKPWDLGLLAGGARLEHRGICAGPRGQTEPEAAQRRRRARPSFHDRDRDDEPAPGELAPGGRSPARRLQHGPGDHRVETRDARRTSASPAAPDEAKNSAEVEIEETIFAFAKAPEEQIAKVSERRKHRRESPVDPAARTETKAASSLTSRKRRGPSMSRKISAKRCRWTGVRLRCGSKTTGRTSESTMASRVRSAISRIILLSSSRFAARECPFPPRPMLMATRRASRPRCRRRARRRRIISLSSSPMTAA